jgi:hypothetical protein
MNLAELVAIDVHTHAEVSCRQEAGRRCWASPFAGKPQGMSASFFNLASAMYFTTIMEAS